jgi:hypothetical protein
MKPGGVISRGWCSVPTAALGVIAFAVVLSPAVALLLAPTLVLFALLAIGHRPGERIIERLRRRFAHHARRLRHTAARSRPNIPVLVRRTGRLLASALAMRPPPAAAPQLAG